MKTAGTILVLFLGATPAAGQVTLDGPHAFPAGRQPAAAATADFDEDGRIDVVVANQSGDTVERLRNDGLGAFTNLPAVATGTNPRDIAVADFDRDGHVDFVTADFYGATLSVHFGDGSFGFAPAVPLSIGGAPYVVRVADIDNDGAPDLLGARGGDVDVFLNDGAGGFRQAIPAGFRLSGKPISADAADFDEDGFLDLVALTLSSTWGSVGEVILVRGDGAGGFAPLGGFSFDALRVPVDIQTMDLDTDGHVDLLAAGDWSGAYAVFGDGTGSFSLPATPIDTGGQVARFGLADMNEDGSIDLVASNSGYSRNVGVVLGDGTRGFAAPVVFRASRTPRRLAVADFDGDRHVDVVVPISGTSDSLPSTVEFFFNRTLVICRAGTVNAGIGAVTDVLFVNDSTGGTARRVTLTTFEPVSIFLASPPASTEAVAYALYGWPGEFVPSVGHALPFGIGTICRPTPLTGGSPQPRVVWNTTGKLSLGAPTMPSPLAPAIISSLPAGTGRATTFSLQGIIADPGSAGSKPASVTNGISIVVR